MIPWICVGILLAGYPLLWWWRSRVRQADLERLRVGAMGILTEQVATLRLSVEAARTEAQTERDKSSRYFLKCTDFENERNEFQRLYTAQSIGHGNAQNLMMQTIEHLAKQLQAKGVRAQIPKVLHIVREDFREQHEMPARALAEQTRETLNPAAAAPQPAPVAATSD